MRAFDNWNSYLDNDGHLLHGKIRFCRKGTTDNVTIYNRDGIAVRNPEFTDMLGRTEYQVFIDEETDVTAYFYKYVGSGEMMHGPGEDYDPARWAYQYSSDNLDPASRVDVGTESAWGVNTMQELRGTDPDSVAELHGVKMLWLYGYYECGDKAPVLYVWDSGSLKNDDGGSVIKADSVPGAGRWVLANRELHFDVRHFGVFPQYDKYSTDFSYTSQISHCATFCDNNGLDAWFPDYDENMAYYLLDGTNTFAINGDIYCSDAVRFMCKTGTTGTRVQCHELHKRTPKLFDSTVHTGTATLVADYVNISWLGGNCAGDARVGWVIDSSEYPRVITGKEVHFKVNGNSALQLDNCVVTSNKRITGHITISNSILKTEWFADNYDWADLDSYGNDIRLENCKDADTYVLLKNKQAEADYGDLNEGTVTGKTLRAGAIVENAMFSNVTLQGTTELHNVSGTVSAPNADLNLNAVDCWLEFTSDVVCTSLALRRGSLHGTNVRVLTSLHLEDADLFAPLNTLGALATVKRCNVSAAVISSNITIENNLISAAISQHAVNGVVNVACFGNRFLTGGYHNISSETPGSVVNGYWVDNSGLGSTMPIQLDRTNLAASETAHSYTYACNSGKFLPCRGAEGSFQLLSTAHGDYYRWGTEQRLSWIGHMDSTTGSTDADAYMFQFQMFTVGTEDIGTLRLEVTPQPFAYVTYTGPTTKMMLLWSAPGVPVCDTERTYQEAQHDQYGTAWAKGFTFVGGYDWRLTRAEYFLQNYNVELSDVQNRVSNLPARFRLS